MRFWGKDRKQDNRKNIWIEHLNIDTGNWFQVFSACLGKMIAIKSIRFNSSEAKQHQVTHGCGGGKISMDFPRKLFR